MDKEQQKSRSSFVCLKINNYKGRKLKALEGGTRVNFPFSRRGEMRIKHSNEKFIPWLSVGGYSISLSLCIN